MKVEIKIPQMGESVSEAIIGTFLQRSGAEVAENDELIELETEKVNQVLYAPAAGVVVWNVAQGDTVSVGDVIGFVDSKGKASKQAVSKEKMEEPKVIDKPVSTASKEGARVSTDLFVEELTKPTAASQPKEDLPEKAELSTAAPQPKEDIPKKAELPMKRGDEVARPMSQIRKVIATRLVDALHNAAMLTTFNEVDMSTIIALRTKYKDSFAKKHGVKLGFMSFFVKAVVEGLKAFPDFNSYLLEDQIITRQYFDVGIAVGSSRGLVVPVVRGCDKLTFAEIEKAIVSYGEKAQSGRIALDELKGGGFTITNGGVFGSLLSTPIINPPQVGILGMHKIQKRPVVIEDKIEIRPMMYLAVSYDHRIVDGKEAVSFLVHIKEVLEDPSRLMFIDTEL